MKIYDITQEVFSGKVFPGDPAPTSERVMSIARGDVCNLTNLSMCTHNGTHMDAPFHFYETGKTMEDLELSRCIGPCTVIDFNLDYTLEDMDKILKTCQKRLLLKGTGVITPELAKMFNQYGILLIGVEAQSVGSADSPIPVHLELLGQEVVILEGLQLDKVEAGDYFLSAAPIKLGGSDGAPCRAVLLDFA